MSDLEERRARAVADLSTRTILATVDVAAPPERLFRALASPEVAEWWGEAGVYGTREWTGDVRVGGRWRASGVGPDGAPFSVEGEFVEVEPPHRLSYTWRPSWAPGSTSTVHYRLDPIEGGTRVTLRHDGFSSADACERHSRGWPRVLDWLSAHAGVKQPGMRSYFLVRLLPPRADFMQTMTSAERNVMRDHGAYWSRLLADGAAVAFGPVADPNGGFGVGILELESAGELSRLLADDPAKKSGLGFEYEVLPMLRAVVRPR